MSNTVRIIFAGDSRDLEKTTRKVRREMDDVDRSAGKMSGAVARSTSSVGESAATAGGSMSRFLGVLANPYVLAAIAATAATVGLYGSMVLLSAMAGTLAVGLVGGMGLAAALLLKNNEKIVSSFTRLRDHVVGSLRKMAQPFESVFVGLANKARESFDRMSPTLNNMFATAAPLVDKLGSSLLSLVENMMPGLQEGLQNSSGFIDVFGERIATLGTRIGEMIASLTSKPEFVEMWGRILDAINWIIEKIPGFSDFILEIWNRLKPVREIFVQLKEEWDKLMANVEARNAVWEKVKISIMLLVGALLLVIATVLGLILTFQHVEMALKAGAVRVGEAFMYAWNAIKDAWARACSFVRSTWQSVVSYFSSATSSVASAFTSLGNRIKSALVGAFNAAANAYNRTIGSLSFTVPGWVPGMGGKGFSMPKIPTFHEGGFVPGARGSETLALLQAGERVIPASRADRGMQGSSQLSVSFTGNVDSAFASAFMKLVRTGQIQLGRV